MKQHLIAIAAATVLAAVSASASAAGVESSTPVGPLPNGPVSTTVTKPGLLVAVALPRSRESSGLVWRVARRYDAGVVRQLSEANISRNVVLVFRIVGRGRTSLVFAMTRGDASPKAVKAATYRIRSA